MAEKAPVHNPYQSYICWYGVKHPGEYRVCGNPAHRYRVTREDWLTCNMWLCSVHAQSMRENKGRNYTLVRIEENEI